MWKILRRASSKSIVVHSQLPLRPIQTNRLIHSTVWCQKDFKLTDIGEGIVQVEVLKWFVKPGDKVKEFDKLVEVQSDKATVEITSRFEGIVKSLGIEEGKMAKVGQVLVVFEDGQGGNPEPARTSHANSSPKVEAPKFMEKATNHEDEQSVMALGTDGAVIATPAVRHLAKENNINLNMIKGTGRDGRIVKSDVLAYLDQRPDPSNPSKSTQIGSQLPPSALNEKAALVGPAVISPPVSRSSGIKTTIVPITGIRREMGKSIDGSISRLSN
jgi:2-oxoisovalerate dehydrogenase E2 component (dihydrolipoyl transacylase)